jgi:predicted O-linked N-acetylglucosamine transferase (SPINDLY family)
MRTDQELSARAAALAAAAGAGPGSPADQVARADALAASGDKDGAIELYRSALASDPAQVHWRCNLSILLADRGRHDEAIEEAEAALSCDPHCAPALYNQATSLLAQGRIGAALERLHRCLALTPADPRVHNNLGLALAADGQHRLALQCYDRALELAPDYWRALNNRGAVRIKLGEFDQAVGDFDRALAFAPRYTSALLNRGAALRGLGRAEAALASFRQAFPNADALEIATDILVRDLHRSADALQCATELYTRHPDHKEAAGLYHALNQGLARWDDYDARVATTIDAVRLGRRASSPFRFLYVTDSAADQHLCARSTADAFPRRPPLWRGEVYDHRRIRVAYLSSDFHSHATAYLAAGLFEQHDRDRFECYAMSHGACPADDPMRPRLQAAFEHFEDVERLSTAEIAACVRDLEIDILIDLKGYTSGSRIEVLSHRPAPVQGHFLGYPGTLGAPFVDYLIADHHVAPTPDASHFSEQIVRMPYSYHVTDDARTARAAAPTRTQAGLPDTGLVLAALHQTYKLTPQIFDLWLRVLRRRRDACLWLWVREPAAQRRLCERAAAQGVDAQRIVFAVDVPQAEHLARLRLADLMLDTWPYSAHTTASDALWAGVPVVALTGRGFASRVSGSILRAAGLPDLVTESPQQYETLITDLCGDADGLHRLRNRVEATVRSSPLFDTTCFARCLEAGYQRMAARYRSGLAPAAFDIEPPRRVTQDVATGGSTIVER